VQSLRRACGGAQICRRRLQARVRPHTPLAQVHQPAFGDTRLCVDAQFQFTVALRRGHRNLNHQQSGRRVLRGVCPTLPSIRLAQNRYLISDTMDIKHSSQLVHTLPHPDRLARTQVYRENFPASGALDTNAQFLQNRQGVALSKKATWAC
jgi:hypothetical protein